MKALFCSVTSIATGGIAAVVPDIELITRCGAAIIAMGSGIMAMRYYYYAAKEKKLSIKNQQSS